MSDILTFTALRLANRHRVPTFKNRHGQPAHTEPDGSDWSLADWYTAFVGEIGEIVEVAHRPCRRDAAGAEIADAVIYLDLLAARAGVDLDRAFGNAAEIDRVGMTTIVVSPLAPANRYFMSALLMGNVIKKITRGDIPLDGGGRGILRDHLVDSMAGLAALARAFDVSLSRAVAEKFNQVSNRVGSPIVLCITGGWWHPWCHRRNDWITAHTPIVGGRRDAP